MGIAVGPNGSWPMSPSEMPVLTPPPPHGSMAMSPSGFLCSRMVPCCSSSSSRLSMLKCLWKAASFSLITLRRVLTWVLVDSKVS